jgi:hypothetical protein
VLGVLVIVANHGGRHPITSSRHLCLLQDGLEIAEHAQLLEDD